MLVLAIILGVEIGVMAIQGPVLYFQSKKVASLSAANYFNQDASKIFFTYVVDLYDDRTL